MRILHRIPLVLGVASASIASDAAAQHCWPAGFALLLREEAGTLVHPDSADVRWHPQGTDEVRYRIVVEPLHETESARMGVPHGASALTWWGRGACRVDVDTVVVRRGGREMRLLPGVHLSTLPNPGPSIYMADTPPFREGTFVLDPLPPGSLPQPTMIPASAWRERIPGASSGTGATSTAGRAGTSRDEGRDGTASRAIRSGRPVDAPSSFTRGHEHGEALWMVGVDGAGLRRVAPAIPAG